jgi:hypothetical protein
MATPRLTSSLEISPAGKCVLARQHRTSVRSRRILFGVARGALLLALCCLSLSPAHAQNFGSGKKKVTLQRRLPAAVHFEGTSFDVHVTAHDAAQASVAQTLGDLLPTDLQRENPKLHQEKGSPDLRIICTVDALDTPKPVPFARDEVTTQKNAQTKHMFYKVSGTLTVAYQAIERGSKVVDSRTITAKYSQDFDAQTNTAANESIGTKVVDPFKRLMGKKTGETETAPTADELRTILITRAVNQIVSRLVNTNEVIEVELARGKNLDAADKLAESGLWSRYLETLETMNPFPDPSVDAYRLYNIGVGYEAQAYKSEDHAAAKKMLEEAAINYGKAIDQKPGEKYFMEPQNRIETAIEHYRALEASNREAAAPSPAAVQPAPAASNATAPVVAPAKSGTRNASPSPATKSPAAHPAATASPALSNDQVIKMSKAGLDDDTIIGAIHDAKSVQFDLTPDGLIQLKQNGVNKNVITAMQTRARAPAHHSAPPNSN